MHIYDIEPGVDVKLYDIVHGVFPDEDPEIGFHEKARRTAANLKIGESFVVPGAQTWDIRDIEDRTRQKIFTFRQREFGVRVWRHA